MSAEHIAMNILIFDQQLNAEILNYIKKGNIKNEDKKNTMHIFIVYILSLVIDTKKNGENNKKKNLDLYENGVATLIYKYDKSIVKIN